MPYPEGGPLRHLPPLTENPVKSPITTPLDEVAFMILSLIGRLSDFDGTNPGASMVLTSFMNRLCTNGQINLVMDMLSCPDEEHLAQLANHLVDAILKPFQIAGGKSPDVLRKACTPLSDDVRSPAGTAVDEDREPTLNECLATLRQHCLVRENFRCRITGKVDLQTYRDNIDELSGKEQPAYLDCAHVIPYAFGDADDTTEVQIRNKKIIWKAMHRYFPQLRSKISPQNINQHANVMVLDRSTHSLFGAGMVVLWCESRSETGDTYRPQELWSGRSNRGAQLRIDAHPKFPAPDALFLDVHRVVSCILRTTSLGDLILQAAGEMQQTVDRDIDSERDPGESMMLADITANCAAPVEGHAWIDEPDGHMRVAETTDVNTSLRLQ